METALITSKLDLITDELWAIHSIIDSQNIEESKKQRLQATLLKSIGYSFDFRQMLDPNDISTAS